MNRPVVLSRQAAVRTGWRRSEPPDALVHDEWLITNGLGGFASASIGGVPTRRYHGHLVAALPAPLGRTVMLNHLVEEVVTPDGETIRLGADERQGRRLDVPAERHLAAFRLEDGLPVWRYEIGSAVLEKRIVMPHLQNTTFVRYHLDGGDDGPWRLRLVPAINFRNMEDPVDRPVKDDYRLVAGTGTFEVESDDSDVPPLRMMVEGKGAAFTVRAEHLVRLRYRVEEARGYRQTGDLWTPGYFKFHLMPGDTCSLVASTEDWPEIRALTAARAFAAEATRREAILARAPRDLAEDVGAELILAADPFITYPAGRTLEAVRAHAVGDEPRTIIAGYHWFTDWGRDTMIGLEGLTLTTGRHEEAGFILRTFAQHLRNGLIPNLFPDRSTDGLYHTADATLWFVHAIDRYVAHSGDTRTLAALMPAVYEIIRHHRHGTDFGIGVDPADGLLRQGAPGYQLTWMDAKVGDWVVTPRRGKAVEIQALWYNALRLAAGWSKDMGQDELGDELSDLADQTYVSFNERFWNPDTGFLFDLVEGEDGRDDPKCRPNQLLAISLPHPVLAPTRWGDVVQAAERHLLTPVGLRSLAPFEPDYRARYDGDIRSRDAAYHQGTVWGWLIGPFVDAWLKVHPGKEPATKRFLEGLLHHMGSAGIGSMSEIFDAEPPFTPRGCIAQAWSVAEVLRCWARARRGNA